MNIWLGIVKTSNRWVDGEILIGLYSGKDIIQAKENLKLQLSDRVLDDLETEIELISINQPPILAGNIPTRYKDRD